MKTSVSTQNIQAVFRPRKTQVSAEENKITSENQSTATQVVKIATITIRHNKRKDTHLFRNINSITSITSQVL